MSVDSCRVHDLKHVSKFRNAVYQLRREKEFSLDILHRQLPKKCCSCFGETSFQRLTLDKLRELCLDLVSASDLNRTESDKKTKLLSTKIEKSRKKRMLKHTIAFDLKNQLDEYSDDEYSDDDEEYPTSSESIRGMIRHRFPRGRTILRHRSPQSSRRRPTVVRRDPALLERFEVIQVPDSCIVHDRKYRSRFQCLLNLFRCTYEFPNRVYHHLPSVCCSCAGRKGLHVIDPVIMRQMCDKIQANSTVKQAPAEQFDWLVLPYEPTLSSEARHDKIGQFIGRNGRNIRSLEGQFHIQLNIIDESSRAKLRERFYIIQAERENNIDGVVLSFTKRNRSIRSAITVEEIKQNLMEVWNAAAQHASLEQSTSSDVEYQLVTDLEPTDDAQDQPFFTM